MASAVPGKKEYVCLVDPRLVHGTTRPAKWRLDVEVLSTLGLLELIDSATTDHR